MSHTSEFRKTLEAQRGECEWPAWVCTLVVAAGLIAWALDLVARP